MTTWHVTMHESWCKWLQQSWHVSSDNKETTSLVAALVVWLKQTRRCPGCSVHTSDANVVGTHVAPCPAA